MADILRPDLCIIGAGALGVTLARHARASGADVVLVDRGAPEPGDAWEISIALAGLNRSAEALHLASRGETFGFDPVAPKVRFKALQERLVNLRTKWKAENSHERLRAQGIEVVVGPAAFSDPATLSVAGSVVKPRAFVLATGSVANVPPIEGLADIDFFTPDSIVENARKLTHLLVIGAGAEALALAQAYRRLGSEVTIVPHGHELSGFDAEAVSALIQSLVSESMTICTGASVEGIQKRSQGIGVLVRVPDGSQKRLDVSHVLVACGRSVSVKDLNSDAAKLRPSDTGKGFEMGRHGRTTNRLVRVTGGLAGIDQWPEALAHGRAVVDALLGGAVKLIAAPPRVVLTQPPLAQVGDLAGIGGKPRSGQRIVRASFAENAEALARGQGIGGVKVTVTANGRIAGASAFGPGAVDVVSALAFAMEQGIPLDRLASLTLPEPSLLSIIIALAENHQPVRRVSSLKTPARALRRYLPF